MHNMVHTLSALKESKDVFIKEPLIDWKDMQRRIAKEQGAERFGYQKRKLEL
jgi:hypothetical protein